MSASSATEWKQICALFSPVVQVIHVFIPHFFLLLMILMIPNLLCLSVIPSPSFPVHHHRCFHPPSMFHPLSLSILVDTATCHFSLSLSLFLFQLSLIEANTKRLSYLLCTNYRQTGRQLTASSSPSPSSPPSSPSQPSSSSSHLQQRLTTTTSNANLTGIIAISSCCCCCCTVHHQHHRSWKLSSGFILCCPLLALKCGACQKRVSKRTTKKRRKRRKMKCVPA